MIKNITQNSIISNSFSYKTGFGKTKGLMFSDTVETIVFNTRFGIHTFFMHFPIDIMVLDKNNKIVFLKENVKPNRIVVWKPVFNLVIEMPQGTINISKTKLGDKISL